MTKFISVVIALTSTISLLAQQKTQPQTAAHTDSIVIQQHALPDVVVEARSTANHNSPTLPSLSVGRTFMLQNNDATFARTLSKIAGISSMDIGAGLSKPVIRGMSFNRIAVIDKGIVQQNQQWGADHALEIDQYDVDNATITKGPASLYYGSDAMGGVIAIQPMTAPATDAVWGDATIIAKSNNSLIGTSVMTSIRRGKWFWRGRITAQQSGDYRIPADTIEYLTWKMPIANRRMKNTAGRETNISLSANYTDGKISSWMHLSEVAAKNGFFPGAHGIPNTARLTPDESYRNIELPFSSVAHRKAISNTSIILPKAAIKIDAGIQQNIRREHSLFHTHYGNQQPPQTNPDLELMFRLNTFSLNTSITTTHHARLTNTAGVSAEMQHNSVAGYSFLLPAFRRATAGAYWIATITPNQRWQLSGGVRYDAGAINIHGFYDQTLEEHLVQNGLDQQQAAFYAQRADNLRKSFGNISASAGATFSPNNHHSMKINLGRSFRFPSANELASNGVHHGAFRHEKGNNQLKPERGVQIDLQYAFDNNALKLTIDPFAAIFDNYIYLNPSGEWSMLPHAGQIYMYEQTRAKMAGAEIEATFAPDSHWQMGTSAEYCIMQNARNGYSLPFTPPLSVRNHLSYSAATQHSVVRRYSIGIENELIAPQNRVAINEDKTPGAALWHASANANWSLGRLRLISALQIHNIFDTPFLNHLSFYRRLNAPEAGRNVQLILKIAI